MHLVSRSPGEGAAELHRTLTTFNRERLVPGFSDGRPPDLDEEARMRLREHRFVEEERRACATWARTAPTDPIGFVAWFEDLARVGPGQGDPLFPWLAEHATEAEMRWFLRQEVAGEAGFDDLVAITQVRMPRVAKMELARNYWDEMGRGNIRGMHGPMLEALSEELELGSLSIPVVWETLALGNLMVALAANRRYAWASIGALGVIELTAPGRAELVNQGLVRLGVSGAARKYYALHAQLDKQHSAAWNREILPTLVEADPRTARAMAEGALMRLRAGLRCFERYRAELWRGGTPDRPTA
jgi:hypothetical protein